MKKILFKALIAISLLSIVNKANAQCGTNIVGTSNFVQYSSLSDMAIAPDNKIYTFAYNTNASQFQLYGAYAAGSWSLVATLSGYTTVKPEIAVSKTGKVSVFFRDNLDGGRGKVYTVSGATFIPIGGAISTSSISNLALAFDLAEKECIAYTDIANSNKSTVKQWNGTSSWDNVGAGTVSPGAGYFNSLIVDKNDKLVLAFQDGNSGNKTNVMRYNAGVWSSIGIVGSSANNCKLKEASNGDYYLGYTELTNNALVHKYNGTVWAQLGTTIGSISSTANNFDMELDAVDMPYLLAVTTSTPDIVFYRYLSLTWNLVTQFSNTSSNILALSIDNTGTPLMFHVDVPFNNGLNVKRLFNPVSISTQPGSMTVCNGTSAFFNVAAVGGTPTFQWQQSAFADFSNIAGATTSNYTTPPTNISMNQYKYRCVVGTGCSNIISNTATLTVSSIFATTTSTNPTCFNSNDGVITSTVTGGVGPYSYSWSPVGGTASTASSLYWNTYTLTATDLVGCITSTVVTLTSPPPISSIFSGNMNICNGSSTSLTITATGGTGGLTYNWSPGGSLSATTGSVVTANPTSTQTYNVQITDAMACVASNTVMVSVNPSPTIVGNASMGTICNGSNVTLSSSGTGIDTYVWNPGGLSGSSQNVTPTSTTIYTVVGTNTTTGCSASSTVAVTVNPLPTVSAGPTRVLTCANTSTTLAGSTTGGVTFNWTGPGIVSGATTLNPTINAPGTYDLSVVSAFGCSAGPSPVSITQNITPPSPTASTTGTLTCSTLTVTLNGSPGTGVTYQWNGPGFFGGTTSQNATATAAGLYTLNVTNSINGCTNTAVTTVSQNTVAPTPSANNSGFLTCVTTSAVLSGGPSTTVSYLWSGPGITGSTTTQNTTANAAGNYTLMVTGSVNGCTNTAVTSLTQNTTAPVPTSSNTGPLTCTTTSVTLNGSPGTGVSYFWSGPGITGSTMTQNTTANSAGNYTLMVTNSVNGCTNSAVTSVVQNTVAPTTSTNVSGTLNCTLTLVNVSASTITTPVTYNWTGTGITSATNISTITVNAPGVKNYTVTNTSNGCIATGSLNVTQNLLATTPTATVTGTVTCLSNTVQLSGNPAAGVTYTWSAPGGSSIVSGTNSQNAIGNGPGTYTLFITMISSGCANSKTVTAMQNTTTPTANAGMDQSITCTAPTVTLSGSAIPSSCTPVWTGGVSSGSNSYNAITSFSGNYTLTVTDPTNGCSSNDEVLVTSNTSIPTITISVNNTLTCANTTATTSVSSSAALPTYLWSGPSIISGGATANATVDQPGDYTVTVTDIPTGCIATSSINVTQDITIPNVTIVSSPSVICSGNSSTLTANGAVTYSWSTAQTTTSISVSPSSTDTYTVYGTGANGCTNYTVETITVNSTPVLAITGNTNICNGSSTTLTGSGATSYTWDSGANTTTISVTPTITTTYTLTGDNGNGCSSLLPVTVSIIPNKAISGVITSTTGATGGDIIIYKYTAALSHWDSLTITPIGGTYSFNNIDSGLYVLRAIPTATNIQVTYADSAVSWQDATIINHGCTNNTTQNIKLIALASYTVGPGVLTGNIVEALGYVPRMSDESKPMVPGTPIGGIIVKGGKNPGGQMFVQTVTDAAGNYTLTGLPINTLPDDYFIFVDIPGLDTNSTYHHLSITSTSTTINGLDFNVDGEYIHPIGSVTGISNDNSVLESKITLFPNPASQKFTLEYVLIQSANVQIELFDVIGHKVKSIYENSFEEKNNYSHSVNLEDLSTGVYFVKVKINNSETTIKLIVSN